MKTTIQRLAVLGLLIGTLLSGAQAATGIASILTCDPNHCSSCENCPGATSVGLYTNLPMAICPLPGSFCIIAQLDMNKNTIIKNCAACATTYAGSCTDCVLVEDNLSLNFCGPNFCWSLGFLISQVQPASNGTTTVTQTNTTTTTTTTNTSETNTTTTNTSTETNTSVTINTTAPVNMTTIDACGNPITTTVNVTTTNQTNTSTSTNTSETNTTQTNTSTTTTTTETNTSTTTTGSGSGSTNSPGTSTTGVITFPVLSGTFLSAVSLAVLTTGSVALLV